MGVKNVAPLFCLKPLPHTSLKVQEHYYLMFAIKQKSSERGWEQAQKWHLERKKKEFPVSFFFNHGESFSNSHFIYSCILQDQKKLQDLLLTEKEAIYGSKPTPRKSNSFRKPSGYSTNGNGSITPTPRRSSVGSRTPDTPRSYAGHQHGYYRAMRRLSTAPLNFVAISKEDTMSSYTSICGSEPGSPSQV